MINILLLISSIKSNENNDSIIMNLYYSEEGDNFTTTISDKRDSNALASAIYNKTYEKIGWDYLSISSYEKKDNKFNDSLRAYGMGYIEGILTKDRIYSHYLNLYDKFLKPYENITIILDAFYSVMINNIEYMKKTSLDNKDKDPYWEHVYYIYQQILGLYEGYKSVSDNDTKLEFKHIILLAGCSDAQDIQAYLFRSFRPNFAKMSEKEKEEYSLYNSHCSAFVKKANDLSDIWFGHNTWNYYILMIRIFKEYRFVTTKGYEKSKTNVFSSYPAALSSIDEFYFLDSNLLVMGTSNNIKNSTLYNLISVESLFIWVRQIVANRLASSAEEWTQIFQKENSGTANEQVMILDINKIDLGNKVINDKALMIIEQMPGYTESADVTEHLRKGYWPSYNVPYIDNIYKRMGYSVQKNEKGEDENVEYTRKERAKIFERDQGNVSSKEAFKNFMRYNDYKNDNISNNNPSKTIAARSDLYNTDNPSCHGAIDVKFVSIKELIEKKNIIYIISGPSNDQQPTFSWKNTTCDGGSAKHVGQNEVWNFPWVDYKIQLIEDNNNNNNNGNNNNPEENEEGDKSYIYWIVFGVVFIVVVVIIILVVHYKKKRIDNFEIEGTNNIPKGNLLE